MNRTETRVIIGIVTIFCMWLVRDDKQWLLNAKRIEVDPLINQKIFLLNDFDQRFFVFHRNVAFHRIKTPVENMMMILQSIDSFNLCDEDWLVDMQFTVETLKEQYEINKFSLDPGIQELMKIQLVLIEKMDQLIKDSDSSSVIEFEEAFGEYMKYYEENISEGGALNEVPVES